MSSITEETKEDLTVATPEISDEQLESITRTPRLSDLIRSGSLVLDHAIGAWGDGTSTGCALTMAHRAAKDSGWA